jgi:hypothetical protein
LPFPLLEQTSDSLLQMTVIVFKNHLNFAIHQDTHTLIIVQHSFPALQVDIATYLRSPLLHIILLLKMSAYHNDERATKSELQNSVHTVQRSFDFVHLHAGFFFSVEKIKLVILESDLPVLRDFFLIDSVSTVLDLWLLPSYASFLVHPLNFILKVHFGKLLHFKLVYFVSMLIIHFLPLLLYYLELL